jgi:hypothetical protein
VAEQVRHRARFDAARHRREKGTGLKDPTAAAEVAAEIIAGVD